jgi:glutathione S-transferase
MYTLYYSPGACSMAVHALLLETGAAFKLENASTKEGKNRSPEFLKINPRGQVPVLKDGEKVLLEGAAILIHIAEAQNSPLLPKSGEARMDALQWLMFANASLHPAYSRVFMAMKTMDEATQKTVMPIFLKSINDLWAYVETRLEASPYLAGKDVTLADILVTVIGNWLGKIGDQPVVYGPKTKALFATISTRPGFQKALAAEQVEYKAAA